MNEVGDWKAKEGPQKRFLECGALEACMGGIVGGGKTSALLVKPLTWVRYPGFAGLILRRTITELTKSDGLIERAAAIYRAVGGTPHEGGRVWTWDTGNGTTSRIDLAGMEHETDRLDYDGSAYQYVAFDELQSFTKLQYTYLFSRMRQNELTSRLELVPGKKGIPIRMRASATPGGAHHDWVLEYFSPWLRAKDPSWTGYCAEDGQSIAYRFDEKANDLVICKPGEEGDKRAYFTTEMLEEVGEDYKSQLDRLDPLTRAQRKFGNWLIRPGAGLFFQESSFVIVDRIPALMRARCRGWDLAATPKKPGEEEGKTAATSGVRVALDANDDIWIEDVIRDWLGPGQVEDLIVDTCGADDEELEEHVLMSAPCDPGQAGIHQKHAYAKRLTGRYWEMTPEQGDKVNRIKPASSHAVRRPIRLLRAPWNESFKKELIGFPFGLKDQADAFSRAYAACLRMPALIPSRDERTRSPAKQRETSRGFGGY